MGTEAIRAKLSKGDMVSVVPPDASAVVAIFGVGANADQTPQKSLRSSGSSSGGGGVTEIARWQSSQLRPSEVQGTPSAWASGQQADRT